MFRSIFTCLLFIYSVHAGLNQLCQLIDFYDKLNVTAECLTYDDYGCWCGPGGSGKPVDKTDSCCYAHDKCYDAIIASKRCSPYFKQYQHNNGTCFDSSNSCEFHSCECDRKLAACLSKTTFNWKHWGHRFWPGTCKD